jgi:hypothetical protein
MSDLPKSPYVQRRVTSTEMPLEASQSDFGMFFGIVGRSPVFDGPLQIDLDGTVWAMNEDSESWYVVIGFEE